ncbi:MAG: hypothetical protein MJ247_00740 [Alphaproteobacteria bacterium]|nr:hypothetical protein [Alphaproteobacteria bacterium]
MSNNVNRFSSGMNLSTDLVSVSSRRTPISTVSQAQESQYQNSRRVEVPFTSDEGFVLVDGKKLYLDAPRGTYVNILV